MKLLEFVKRIKRKFSLYQPLIEVLIYKENILHNLKQFQSEKVKVAPVLKSNAYGHGLVEVANILKDQDIAFLVVDSYYEASMLRKFGINNKVLVLGFTNTENIVHNSLKNVSFNIVSLAQLKELSSKLTAKTFFHLKVDTGMHRQGILEEEVSSALDLIKKNSKFVLEGLCSHFADADSNDSSFTLKQIEKWNKLALQFKTEFPALLYFHVSNTAGKFYEKEVQANVLRVGLGLYGINPGPKLNLDLKPALEITSVISGVTELKSGESVGYGATFTAKSKIKVATVPIGYFEGVDRRLSNCGMFLVKETQCPIVGRVSMNITTIDVTKVKTAALGDKVVVVSKNPKDSNSIENTAKNCATIPYELLVHIPQHLRRTVI